MSKNKDKNMMSTLYKNHTTVYDRITTRIYNDDLNHNFEKMKK